MKIDGMTPAALALIIGHVRNSENSYKRNVA